MRTSPQPCDRQQLREERCSLSLSLSLSLSVSVSVSLSPPPSRPLTVCACARTRARVCRMPKSVAALWIHRQCFRLHTRVLSAHRGGSTCGVCVGESCRRQLVRLTGPRRTVAPELRQSDKERERGGGGGREREREGGRQRERESRAEQSRAPCTL